MRDLMIFYRSFYEALKELPKENQLELYNAIFEYSLDFKEVELSGLSKTIFTLIKPQLEANNKRYENGAKYGHLGAEHGKKGGRPKKKPPNNPQETPKKPPRNPQITPKKPPNPPRNPQITLNYSLK